LKPKKEKEKERERRKWAGSETLHSKVYGYEGPQAVPARPS